MTVMSEVSIKIKLNPLTQQKPMGHERVNDGNRHNAVKRALVNGRGVWFITFDYWRDRQSAGAEVTASAILKE